MNIQTQTQKIREKLAQLKGDRKKNFTSDWRWKPPMGESKVRLVSWKEGDLFEPFKELYFYYDLGRSILSPYQFQKPDPIKEFQKSLYDKGDAESRELAKKLYPTMRAYVPVLIRGEEDKGIRLWAVSKTLYQEILEMFVDPEVGTLNDPLEGRDLKVKVVQRGDKKWPDTKVFPAMNKSRLLEGDEELQKLLDNAPSGNDLKEKYKLLSYDEVQKILNDFLNGDENNDEEGTSRGNSVDEFALDDAENNEEKTETPLNYDNFDDAFGELLEDNEKVSSEA
mgnify:CR=1 FL=1